MKIIDPGHKYELQTLDGELKQILQFVKREGNNYPGNIGHYPGTIIQDVLRVCIDRIKYMDTQIPAIENMHVLKSLRYAMMELEIRAARRYGKHISLGFDEIVCIESYEVGSNGHLLIGAGEE